MPLYEYHCRTCDRTFPQLRAIGQADAPIACPGGHRDVTRTLSLVAPTRRGTTAPAEGPPAGGCCGGACGCGH